MDKAKSAIVTIVFLALIGGMGYGLYAAARILISGLHALNPNVAAAIVAASATIIVSVLIIVYNQRKTHAREIANSCRPKKIEI